MILLRLKKRECCWRIFYLKCSLFMDKISKFLNKLSKKEYITVKDILEKIKKGELADLDVKKLKGQDVVYRVRKGDLRIIYGINETGKTVVVGICRRNDNTYKF